MQRLLILLCLLQILFQANGQPGFSNIYEFNNHGALIQKLIVTRDTIVSFGSTRSATGPPFQWCLQVSRFDTTGAFIDSVVICDPLGGAFTMDKNWADLVATNDKGVALIGFSFDRYDGLFIKLDRNLNLQFIQEFTDSVNLVEFYYNIVELSDGFLLGGYLARPNSKSDGFLRKIDQAGNTIWFEYLGNYIVHEQLAEIHRLTDTTVILTGGYQYNLEPSEYHPWILISDLDGNILKEWKPQMDVGISVIHYIHPVSPDIWLIYGTRNISTIPSTVISQSFIATMDTNFQVTAMQNIGQPSPPMSICWAIVPAADGSFIGVGEAQLPKPSGGYQEHGWLLRFTENLDTLWTRTDLAPVPGGAPNENYLAGAGELSSGNIVAGGTSRVGSDYYCWLVKVTADGCIDTLFCNPVGTGDVPVAPLQEAAAVPNPADTHTVITAGGVTGPCNLKVFTAAGSLTAEQRYTPGTLLDVAFWPNGMYHLLLRDGKGEVKSCKVVVVH